MQKLSVAPVHGKEATAASSAIGSRGVRPAKLAHLELGDARFRNLAVYLTGRAGAKDLEDGILPLALFDAIYVNIAARFVIPNPRRGWR